MGPESILGGIAGSMVGKLQLSTLLMVGVIALAWLIYRDYIWKVIK